MSTIRVFKSAYPKVPSYWGFALVLLAAGACKPKPPTGIMVDCDSNGANSYQKWFVNNVDCVAKYGAGVTNCYLTVPAENVQHCYEKDEWLAAGTDTGGEAEETEGIDRNT